MFLTALVASSVASSAVQTTAVPVIDVSHLRIGDARRQDAIDAIREACIEHGFFQIIGHGVSDELQRRLELTASSFFDLPMPVKRRIEMAVAGRRWRGYFCVGEEVTSGIVDQKEGLYFARELPPSDLPLHGPNLFPSEEECPGLRAAVLDYMSEVSQLSAMLLEAVAVAIGLPQDHFRSQFEDPTTLFRIFNYPPHDSQWGAGSFGVGEHTDYGYLTVLKQDGSGGLQAKVNGQWTDVEPIPNALVVNLGDALEYVSGGLLRATPHRVLPRKGASRGRLSFPFFFDPSFTAPMRSCHEELPAALQRRAEARRRDAPARWDGKRVHEFRGTYGDYLLAKVSKVFPELSQRTRIEEA